MNIDFLKLAEKKYGKKFVLSALDITFDDIKFNRVGFNKITKPVEFKKIFNRSLKLCLSL
jgi:hypothetical protein